LIALHHNARLPVPPVSITPVFAKPPFFVKTLFFLAPLASYLTMVLKADLERENQELRAQVAELQAERIRHRRRLSESDLSASFPRRSATPSTLLQRYPPSEDHPPPSESRPPTPSRTLTPVVPAPVLKDLKIDPPPEFSGKTSEYTTFIGACQFYFANKPVTFGAGNEANKVSFVISRLRGYPATWAHALRDSNADDPILQSWPLFKAEMDILFANPFYKEEIRRQYKALKQTGSAIVFSTEFKALAAILNKSESDKSFEFKEKLKDNVQIQLAGLLSIDETFESLVRKAIQVDQALFNVDKALKKAVKSQTPGPLSSSQTPFRPPQPQQPRNNPSSSSGGSRNSSFPAGSRASSAAPGSVHATASTPRPPLSDAEKQYREDNNLCRYCGSKDHFRKDCDKYKKKLEIDAKKGLPPRYPPPPSSAHINASSAPARPVTVSHIISPPGKYDPQGH
jgi:hypothetical protein